MNRIAVMRRVRSVPYLGAMLSGLRHTLQFWRWQRRNAEALGKLGVSSRECSRRILAALRMLERPLFIDVRNVALKIEAERSEFNANREPLRDGTLDSRSAYDAGRSVAEACANSKPYKESLLLYMLVAQLQPRIVVELGTNLGISAAYIAAALCTTDERHGCVITLDASLYKQRLARQMHGRMGLSNVIYVDGLFDDTLENTLAKHHPVDFAFIDGHHQYQPTLDYANMIMRYAHSETIFVFDDIRWSADMCKAWDEIVNDERYGLIVDLESMGVCVPRSSAGEPKLCCSFVGTF